jgi:hypothetical protein
MVDKVNRIGRFMVESYFLYVYYEIYIWRKHRSNRKKFVYLYKLETILMKKITCLYELQIIPTGKTLQNVIILTSIIFNY